MPPAPGPPPSMVPYQAEPRPESWDPRLWHPLADTLDVQILREIVLRATISSVSVQQDVIYSYHAFNRPHATIADQLDSTAPPQVNPGLAPPHRPDEANEPQETEEMGFQIYLEELDNVNNKYSSNSGSREYDNAFPASNELETLIASIRAKAHARTAWATRRNALEALHSIADTIVDAPSSTLGSEIRKHFDSDDTMAEAMVDILESVNAGERKAMAGPKGQRDRFLDQMRTLETDAKSYALEMGWERVVALLEESETWV